MNISEVEKKASVISIGKYGQITCVTLGKQTVKIACQISLNIAFNYYNKCNTQTLGCIKS